MELSQKRKVPLSHQNVVSAIFGFLGGMFASLLIFGLNKIPEEVIARGHPLISAPFLAFVLIVAFVVFFYNPLHSLLTRGQLTIKWGDKEISLSEIENKVDDEFHVYESRLADLDVELRGIKALLYSERDRAAKPEEPSLLNATALGKIKAALPWVGSDQLALLVYHLGNSQFKWRNQDTISHKTGFHVQVIDDLVASVPEHIIRAKSSKSGKIIYRLSDHAKGQLMQIDLMAN